MKFPSLLLLAALAAVLPCCQTNRTTSSPARESVFPNFTTYPQKRSVPQAVIADLPRRLQHLPDGRGIPLDKLVKDLGLAEYRGNVSNNMRGNHHFLYLDDSHILCLEIDLDTLPKNPPPFSTPWKSKVVSCTLRKNPDFTIARRVLVPAR